MIRKLEKMESICNEVEIKTTLRGIHEKSIYSIYDVNYMKEALKLAQEAYDASEVPVGCVFVHQGKIIASGRNRTNESLNVIVSHSFQ